MESYYIKYLYYIHLLYKKTLTVENILMIGEERQFIGKDDLIDIVLQHSNYKRTLKTLNGSVNKLDGLVNLLSVKFGRKSKYAYIIRKCKYTIYKIKYDLNVFND